jgi:hypothetical protein
MFTMLDFVLRYRKALELMSGERGNGLREYELKEEEWKIIAQLCDVLKACGARCLHAHAI